MTRGRARAVWGRYTLSKRYHCGAAAWEWQTKGICSMGLCHTYITQDPQHHRQPTLPVSGISRAHAQVAVEYRDESSGKVRLQYSSKVDS